MKNEFHPMWKRPQQVKDEIFSETVIVYGVDFDKIDLDDSKISDAVMGWFDFEKQRWFIHAEESIPLICWCEIPNPQEFMKDKFRNWSVEFHDGYRP